MDLEALPSTARALNAWMLYLCSTGSRFSSTGWSAITLSSAFQTCGVGFAAAVARPSPEPSDGSHLLELPHRRRDEQVERCVLRQAHFVETKCRLRHDGGPHREILTTAQEHVLEVAVLRRATRDAVEDALLLGIRVRRTDTHERLDPVVVVDAQVALAGLEDVLLDDGVLELVVDLREVRVELVQVIRFQAPIRHRRDGAHHRGEHGQVVQDVRLAGLQLQVVERAQELHPLQRRIDLRPVA